MPDTILYMLRGLTFSGKTTLDKTLEYPQQDERALPFQLGDSLDTWLQRHFP